MNRKKKQDEKDEKDRKDKDRRKNKKSRERGKDALEPCQTNLPSRKRVSVAGWLLRTVTIVRTMVNMPWKSRPRSSVESHQKYFNVENVRWNASTKLIFSDD